MYLHISITQNWVLFKIATSVWFFLKRFSKFRKFQPRYSYKIYSDIKRVYSDNARSTVFYQLKIWPGILILYSFVLQNWCRYAASSNLHQICTSFVVRNYTVLRCLVKYIVLLSFSLYTLLISEYILQEYRGWNLRNFKNLLRKNRTEVAILKKTQFCAIKICKNNYMLLTYSFL